MSWLLAAGGPGLGVELGISLLLVPRFGDAAASRAESPAGNVLEVPEEVPASRGGPDEWWDRESLNTGVNLRVNVHREGKWDEFQLCHECP